MHRSTKLFTCLTAILLFTSASVHATFSIVAFDPVTKELGSAVATCVDDTDLGFFVSRFAPGQGAINAQSFASVPNLLNGRQRLLDGDSAEEALQWLIDNDVNGSPGLRQYAIVDLGNNSSMHSVTYSGADNFDFAGGTTGENYAIAGNILSGESIIEQMESAFLQTNGWLGFKLMAALQAAKEPMADSRCASTSSLSAYISVTKQDDVLDVPFLRINTRSPNTITDPIDLLQNEFDAFLNATYPIDTDQDGIPDEVDNCVLVSNPLQIDVDSDGFGNYCDADIDNNCQVSFIDYTTIFANFLATDLPLLDFNSDGVINFIDVSLFIPNFISPPGPSGLVPDCGATP